MNHICTIKILITKQYNLLLDIMYYQDHLTTTVQVCQIIDQSFPIYCQMLSGSLFLI